MSNSRNADENKDVKKGWFVAGIITISLAIFLPFIIMMISGTSFSVSKLGELGAVGDFFGGSTIGLLSIASIFFIIHTISIQSKELSLQRQELHLTRNELEETRKVHEAANRTQYIQRFETTFFNMLSLQSELIKNLEIGSQNKLIGRAAIEKIYKKFEGYFQSPNEKTCEKMAKALTALEKFYPVYDDFFENYSNFIEPYFRNVEILILLIENGEFSRLEKNHYLNILKAQLSKSELKLLFYNTAYNTEHTDPDDRLINIDFFQGYIDPTDLIHVDHTKFLIL